MVAVYRATFTAGVQEENTARTERTHPAHAECVLGGQTPTLQVTAATLQQYIEARTAETFRGRPINPQTIKKELATLRYVWNWAFRNKHIDVRFPGEELVSPKVALKEPFRTPDQIATAVARGGLAAAQVQELRDALDLNPAEIGEVLEHVRRNAAAAWLYPLRAAAHTKARRGERIRARLDDSDFANRVIALR